jgi:hypothetical protein
MALWPLLSCVLLFSTCIVLISVPTKAKAELRHCLGLPSWIYFGMVLVANSVSGFGTFGIFHYGATSDPQALLEGFLRAFFAVFGLNFMLSNMSLAFFGKRVLDFEGWSKLARDWAVSLAIARQADADIRQQETIAERYRLLPDAELNALVLSSFGARAVTNFETRARSRGADAHLYKALRLAEVEFQKRRGSTRRRG